jgi:hypothetical protein
VGSDLNGDGDLLDNDLIHVYDAATDVVTGLGLSGSSLQISEDVLAFAVPEFAHGDLNGDGDTWDWPVHVYDFASGVTTNLGLDPYGGISHIDGEMFAFPVAESSQGNSDLNGDGDTSDVVLHIHDAASGTTTNLELAEDKSNYPRFSGRRVAFTVSETDQGNTDLNGDGDTLDTVVHVADFSVQTVEIDIRPNNDNELLNVDSNGMLAVAILSTEEFDATRVHSATVQFAGAFAEFGMLQDVDHDGDVDMVLYFRIQDTALDEIYAQLVEDDLDEDGILDSNHQKAEVTLTGETLDNLSIKGSDSMDLFLSGKALRELLDELAAEGVFWGGI